MQLLRNAPSLLLFSGLKLSPSVAAHNRHETLSASLLLQVQTAVEEQFVGDVPPSFRSLFMLAPPVLRRGEVDCLSSATPQASAVQFLPEVLLRGQAGCLVSCDERAWGPVGRDYPGGCQLNVPTPVLERRAGDNRQL